MNDELLPLFPLEVVLFPAMSLPLHIFEPRYKQMIRYCLDREAEFGVVLARKEDLAQVGCSAEIVKLVKEFEDGRMNILTVGLNRFRLLQVIKDLPYWQGRVEVLEEDEETSGPLSPASPLLKFFAEATRLVSGEATEAPRLEGGQPPSFQIAATLPLDLEVKQQVLELDSEVERQQALESHLQQWLPRLRRVARLKEKAGGNGHG